MSSVNKEKQLIVDLISLHFSVDLISLSNLTKLNHVDIKSQMSKSVDLKLNPQCQPLDPSQFLSTLSAIFNFDLKSHVKKCLSTLKNSTLTRPPKRTREIQRKFYNQRNCDE